MTISEMQKLANQIRRSIIKMLSAAGSGHSAGSLSVVEVLTTLYFHVMQHRPKEPNWPDRDRFILSCGHVAPALYAVLAQAGYFSPAELIKLRKLNSPLQGHPHLSELPGIENSSGPLGQGLSLAVGMALAARMDDKHHRIYCLMSDGEQDEGQVWEAVMLAAKEKLGHLIAIIDRNNIQIDGFTEDIMPLESLSDKYKSFNWHVIETDGHSIGHLIDAFQSADSTYDKPTVIIANTIPGKGVDFMERDYSWHGKVPNAEQVKEALRQLDESRSNYD